MTPEQVSSMAHSDIRQSTAPRRGRPPFNTHQSSSVPSTPIQQARDVRFSSRSPSPSKTLGANSPQSVASEAVGVAPAASRLAQPLVCKFEIGAEIKKRRIIYTEGGNDPLPPPKDEPKKHLEPHEDDKLTGDMRELYDRLLPTDESEERRAKLVQKLHDILNNEWPGNEIKVNVFGSSGNLLSSTDSDVDVCITTTEKKVESMHTLAAVLHRHGMENVVCRASAKVPIVKCWDPELQLACDLNVNNPLALENTRMIRTYVQMDDRIRPLAKIIKYWTKQRLLNDAAFGGTISSYTWICMIINFLQIRRPPIVPSLQKIPDWRSTTSDGQPSAFADDIDHLRAYGKDNHESLGQLLFHFFRHYGYAVDYGAFVISVKEGRLLPRKEKGWDASNWANNKEARSSLCVEEPFNTPRNLGNSADDYAWTGIHKEIRRAFDLIKEGSNLDRCCEQYEFPPEEKSSTLFQRPVPKLPVLRRSASQAGSANTNGQGRPAHNAPRNSRNTANQRSNNRRASSGANFTAQRVPYTMSPPVGPNPADYFSATRMSTDQLHDQLYKQYQYLQAQQEALRNQLLQQQQQTQAQLHAQVQAQAQVIAASPRQHRTSFTTALPPSQGQHVLDAQVATAPLLPGSLYHYPARYPPPSPLAQSRTTEELTASQSSPLQSNNLPSLRRGAHRNSVTSGSASLARSQSQPGRSFPNLLTLQGLVHPGYDVSGAVGSPYIVNRPNQGYPQIQTNGTIRQANGMLYTDTAMPKEYVGYYVGQSPQLLPQYQAGIIPQMPPLQGLPSQTSARRMSPEDLVAQGMSNGMYRSSRSPSPSGLERTQSSSAMMGSSSAQHSSLLSQPSRQPTSNGPVIVNGSNTAYSNSLIPDPSLAGTVPTPSSHEAVFGLGVDMANADMNEQLQELSLERPNSSTNGYSHHDQHPPAIDARSSATAEHASKDESSDTRRKSSGASHYSLAQQGDRIAYARNMAPLSLTSTNGPSTSANSGASSAAPVLSPVEELRTPSPTLNRAVDTARPGALQTWSHPAPYAGDLQSTSKKENSTPVSNGSTPPHQNPNSNAEAVRPQQSTASNGWQPAPSRKGHKKSKSTSAKKTTGTGGEPLPANEADRKGG